MRRESEERGSILGSHYAAGTSSWLPLVAISEAKRDLVVYEAQRES